MDIKEKLVKILGANNVFDDTKKLKQYSKDHSLSRPGMPSYVVRPKNAEEIQQVVRLANDKKLPVVPCSSGIHFDGNTIPVQGGIILDLRRMNRILDIDDRNRMARFEPGVTWQQLQPELEKYDLMALNPLLPHPLKSALSSHLEREPMLIPKFEYTDNLMTMEVVLPDGELFRTGSACVTGFPDNSLADGVNPSGPGMVMWNRLLQGAQGTLGIVTWVQVKAEFRPRVNKTFFIPFNDLHDAVELVYKIQKRMVGEECLILNKFNLAAILATKWPADFNTLNKALPPWTVIMVLGGGKRFPEEKIEYEEEALREVAAQQSIIDLPTSIGAAPGVERDIVQTLRNAWPENKTYWKFAFKGACQDLFFQTTLNEVTKFTRAINDVVIKHDYSTREIGFYIQPMVYGGVCHFETNFYYHPDEAEEVAEVKALFTEAAATALDMGGFFSRPYGLVSDMVYSRTAGYTEMLKKVKQMFDPNNIMSPGRLCF